jgi:hypothetical protein
MTRMPPRWELRVTWTASATVPAKRASTRPTLAGWACSSGTSRAVLTRKFRIAAMKNKPAAPANTTAGVVTASRVPPATPPRAWLKVFTVLVPVADATNSWGLRARTRTIRDWAGRYCPEAAESKPSNSNRRASGAPAATRAALASNPRARAVEIHARALRPRRRSQVGVSMRLLIAPTKKRSPTKPTAIVPSRRRACTESAVT